MTPAFLFFVVSAGKTLMMSFRGGSGVLRRRRNSRSGGDFPLPQRAVRLKDSCVSWGIMGFALRCLEFLLQDGENEKYRSFSLFYA